MQDKLELNPTKQQKKTVLYIQIVQNHSKLSFKFVLKFQKRLASKSKTKKKRCYILQKVKPATPSKFQKPSVIYSNRQKSQKNHLCKPKSNQENLINNGSVLTILYHIV